MSTGAIVAIVVVVLVVVALLAVFAVVNRRRRLRDRFGPEYDRAVTEHDSKRQAEAELAGRERRVRQLDIRPLSPTSRARYSAEWTAVQEQFVDAPQAAVAGAQTLISAVMTERGYPTEAHDQTMADLSVEHAGTLDRYRAAHDISQRAASGNATTEELRQAMVNYRALFAELLGVQARQDVPAGSGAVSGAAAPAAGPTAAPGPGGSTAGPGPAATATTDRAEETTTGPPVASRPQER